MRDEPTHHPIQELIDAIYAAGHTPRIQLDATADGVEVPAHVRDHWGKQLVLDLDASWPLHLEYTDEGIEVDLAFQGNVSRCVLPWTAIYVVLDRATGGGHVVDAHVPDLGDELGEEPPARPRAAPARAASHASTPPSAGAPASASEEEARKRRSRFKVIDGGG